MKTLLSSATRLMAALLALPIRAYQLLISPWLPPACRYQPTCSEYALQALREHGPIRGLALALRRIGRCHPWGGFGPDPVPHRHVHLTGSTAEHVPAASGAGR